MITSSAASTTTTHCSKTFATTTDELQIVLGTTSTTTNGGTGATEKGEPITKAGTLFEHAREDKENKNNISNNNISNNNISNNYIHTENDENKNNSNISKNHFPNSSESLLRDYPLKLTTASSEYFGSPLESVYSIGEATAAVSALENRTMCSASHQRLPNQRKRSSLDERGPLDPEQPLQPELVQSSVEEEEEENLLESHQQEPGENQGNSREEYAHNQSIKALEDRVQDLETKLLVLSRLLQIQRSPVPYREGPIEGKSGNSRRLLPPLPPPPPLLRSSIVQVRQQVGAHAPRRGAGGDEEKEELSGARTPPDQVQSPLSRKDTTTSAAFPHLESPATWLGIDSDIVAAEIQEAFEPAKENYLSAVFEKEFKQNVELPAVSQRSLPPNHMNRPDCMTLDKRNLSFNILYEGDELKYENESRSDPNAQMSMTPSERRWLGAAVVRHKNSMEGTKTTIKTDENNSNHNNNINSDDCIRNKWLDYLNSFQESTADIDAQMEDFVKVPGYVESIMTFGFLISVDSFLYIFTILPIRFVWSSLLLVLRILSFWTNKPPPPYQFHRRHSYQMIQVFLLYVIYQYVLAPISIGKLYHWIRGQAMIKLYVLLAIVEVFDRLMCSLGQDCLDSMYWNAVNRPKSSRMLISVAVVLLYATCHTLLLFLHVATLNVAMNSADIALLALFISGNFAEIKSSVFKKYNKPALFKLTAADICERFKLGLFLGLVLLLNICQGMDQGQFMDYVRVCAIVWCAELLADWVKHSFITKFNILPAKVYDEYQLLLAGDFTGIGHEGVNLDHSHAVVKRIGFAQLPLVCVTLRLLREAAKYATINEYWPQKIPVFGFISLVVVWFLLLAIKLSLGRTLHLISWKKLKKAHEIIPPQSSFSQSKKKR